MRFTKTPNCDLFLLPRALPETAYFFPKIVYERNTAGDVSSGPSGLKVFDLHGSTFELEFLASSRQKGNLMLTRANQTMMHAVWPTSVRVTQFGTESFELARVRSRYLLFRCPKRPQAMRCVLIWLLFLEPDPCLPSPPMQTSFPYLFCLPPPPALQVSSHGDRRGSIIEAACSQNGLSSLLAYSEHKKISSHLMYHMYEKAASTTIVQNLQAPLFAWNIGSQVFVCASSTHYCRI